MAVPGVSVWLTNTAIDLAEFGLSWLLQSTLLILAGLATARILYPRGSAMQSVLYRTTLAAVLLCPVVGWVVSMVGAEGCPLQFPLPGLAETSHLDDGRLRIASKSATQSTPTPDGSVVEAQDNDHAEAGSADVAAAFPSASDHRAEEPAGGTADTATSPIAAQPTAGIDTPITERLMLPVVEKPSVWLAAVASALWAVVSVIWLVRLAVSWRRLSRLRHAATFADRQTELICREIAGEMGVTAPEVRRSPFVSTPCVTGLRRPAILLPEEAISMPLRDVLIHELAHLRRRDCHWNLLRRLALAVFWFQPLLWRLSRRIDTSSEDVCDDHVLQSGAARRSYAQHLVEVAELALPPAAAVGVGIVSSRYVLTRRVDRILDTSRGLTTRVGRCSLTIVISCALVGTTTVGLLGVGRDAAAEALSAAPPGEPENPGMDDSEWSEPPDGMIRMSGRVLDPDDRPVAGATIRVCGSKEQIGDTVVADRDGNFHVEFRYADFTRRSSSSYIYQTPAIVASARGFGPAWLEKEHAIRKRHHTFRLVRDDVPIRGRILDTHGNPVPQAELRTIAVLVPHTGNLDEFLTGWRDEPLFLSHGGFRDPTSSLWSRFIDLRATTGELRANEDGEPIVVTDDNGRFELTGIGRERVLVFTLRGRDIQTSSYSMVTSRQQIESAWERMSRHVEVSLGARQEFPGLFPATFEHVGQPGRSVTGVVRDRDTKKPVAGVSVWGNVEGLECSDKATTDAAGRYVLNGMATEGSLHLTAIEHGDHRQSRSYLGALRSGIPLSPKNPLEGTDFELVRGVIVHGRIVNAETGEPANANVYYLTYPENPHVERLPDTLIGCTTETREDGEFQFPVLPGPGSIAVGVRLWGSTESYLPIRPEDFGRPLKNGRIITAYPAHTVGPERYAAVAHINPDFDTESVEVELTVHPDKGPRKAKTPSTTTKRRTPIQRVGRATGRYLWRTLQNALGD